jgi:hypothetical protein
MRIQVEKLIKPVKKLLFLNNKALLRNKISLVIKMAEKSDNNSPKENNEKRKQLDNYIQELGEKQKEIDSKFNFIDEKMGIYET